MACNTICNIQQPTAKFRENGGTNGDGNSFRSNAAQSMPSKNECVSMSAGPFEPSLSAGNFANRCSTIFAAAGDMYAGTTTACVSMTTSRAWILDAVNGGLPLIISNISAPKLHLIHPEPC